ncbi:MAG: hypothetical protein WAQ28_19020 [Bacteroidia bacterium]|jgi:hypothetical protein
MKTLRLPILLSILVVTAASCKKEETPEPTPAPTPSYTVPTTYNFTNVSYTGQTQRIAMMDEISTYMRTGIQWERYWTHKS